MFFSFCVGGKALTCANKGKCKDNQCQCTDQFSGHDCRIGNYCAYVNVFFV